jgi:hypothetical protein
LTDNQLEKAKQVPPKFYNSQFYFLYIHLIINYVNMKEWFKKHLGWLGFGAFMACALIVALDDFIFKTSLNDNLIMIGFYIMITAELIQGILNEKYFTKYSEKVKNGIIVFIVTITIGAFYLLAKP